LCQYYGRPAQMSVLLFYIASHCALSSRFCWYCFSFYFAQLASSIVYLLGLIVHAWQWRLPPSEKMKNFFSLDYRYKTVHLMWVTICRPMACTSFATCLVRHCFDKWQYNTDSKAAFTRRNERAVEYVYTSHCEHSRNSKRDRLRQKLKLDSRPYIPRHLRLNQTSTMQCNATWKTKPETQKESGKG